MLLSEFIEDKQKLVWKKEVHPLYVEISPTLSTLATLSGAQLALEKKFYQYTAKEFSIVSPGIICPVYEACDRDAGVMEHFKTLRQAKAWCLQRHQNGK